MEYEETVNNSSSSNEVPEELKLFLRDKYVTSDPLCEGWFSVLTRELRLHIWSYIEEGKLISYYYSKILDSTFAKILSVNKNWKSEIERIWQKTCR